MFYSIHRDAELSGVACSQQATVMPWQLMFNNPASFLQNAIYIHQKLVYFHPAWSFTSSVDGVLTRHTRQTPSDPQRCLDSTQLLSGSNLTESTLFILKRAIQPSLGLFRRDCPSSRNNTQCIKLMSLHQQECKQSAGTVQRNLRYSAMPRSVSSPTFNGRGLHRFSVGVNELLRSQGKGSYYVRSHQGKVVVPCFSPDQYKKCKEQGMFFPPLVFFHSSLT